MLKLIIEDDEGRKTVVPFVRDEITIGRQEGNTIRLTERNVSRRHARLLRSNGHVLIEDLGSYNGIRINGDRITGQVQVADGDLIQIGDYDLALQAEESKGATPILSLDSASAPTRKLQEMTATLPLLPAVEAPQEAADEDVRDADEGEVGSDAPPAIPRHQSTAVIRIDQVEGNTRKRPVAELGTDEAPRLVVLNTDFAGREFACKRTELKIGRTDDNDIAIDHRSLSRTHCKVVREESGEWRVVDMQSANGLMVNGESYAQVTLRPGDVLELGHVKLKFVGPGEQVHVPPSASSNVTAETDPVASKTPLIAIAVALLVLILGGGGYIAWKKSQEGVKEKSKEPIATRPTPPPDERQPGPEQPAVDAEAGKQAALARLAEAKAAVAELDWSKAEALAKEATVDGVLLPDAKSLLAALDSEKPNRNALEQAARLLEAVAERPAGDKTLAGSLEKARVQLDAAAGTKLLKARYDELEGKRAKLVAEKVRQPEPKQPEPKQPEPKQPEPKQPEPKQPEPVAKAADPKQAEAEALFKEASDEKKAKNYERAANRLERCVKVAPTYPPCYRLLGSVYASIATRDQSQADMEKARKFYQRFVEVAPPDDEYVPKVKAILEQANQ